MQDTTRSKGNKQSPPSFFVFLTTVLVGMALRSGNVSAADIRVRQDQDKIHEIDNGLIRMTYDTKKNHTLTGFFCGSSAQPLVLKMLANCGDGKFTDQRRWKEDNTEDRMEGVALDGAKAGLEEIAAGAERNIASRQNSARIQSDADQTRFEVEIENRIFTLRRIITVFAGKPYVKIAYEQTFKCSHDTFSGGIEIDFAKSLNAFCSPRGDGTYQTDKDVAAGHNMQKSRWFARDWYAAYCPSTKEGVIVLIPDKKPWEYFLSPQITRAGAGRHRMSMSHPRLMFQKHDKGDTLKGEFYLMAYQGNPEEIGPSVYAELSATVFPPSVPSSAHQLSGSSGVNVWSEISAKKVFREDSFPVGIPKKTRIEVHAARNEYEAFQLVVAPTNDVKCARLAFSDLKGPGVIAAKNIRYNPVGYVNCREFSGPYYSFWARVGWNPDPLLLTETVAVPKNKNTVFWITVYVPDDTPAGDYEGNITLHLDEQSPVVTPLRLHVYDFTIPRTPTLQIYAHYCSSGNLSQEELLQNLLEHRVRWINFPGSSSPSLVKRWGSDGKPRLDFDAANFEKTAQWLVRHPDVNFTLDDYKIGGNSIDIGGLNDKFLTPYYDNFRQGVACLKAKGIAEERLFLYPWDEPFDDLPVLQWLATLYDKIQPLSPNAKIMLTHEPNPAEGLYGRVDIWAPNINWYHHSERWCKERQAKGEHIWTYNNCIYMVDTPAINARIIGWLMWKHQIDGYLIYLINSWGRNPWIFTDGAGYGRNGDGLLIYPDPEGKGRVVNSIRWEQLRDGFEDHEYFSLLRERVRQIRQKGLRGTAVENAEAALTIHADVVEDLWRFTKDPLKLNDIREKIAGLIEQLGQQLGKCAD